MVSPFFPWGSYLAFGVMVGAMSPFIQKTDWNTDWNKVMQWSALLGIGLIMGGRYFADLPYSLYTASDFWINSPALVACKMGVACLLASFAYLWMEYLNTGWSFVRQLGTTSLVVYWVHVDLEYGPWFAAYRQKLGVVGCIAVSLLLIPVMVGVSVGFTRIRAHYKRRKLEIVPLPVEAGMGELLRKRA